MSFNAKFNATNGKIEWEETDKDYQSLDCNISDEFSRSHYGDMLHDTERNQKYYVGLRWAIEQVKGRGVEPRILDIGTGTGLLSMMAAECGARHVTACEVFKPMIKIANDTISTNGYDKVIKVIPKRSTDIIIGEDMPEKANILVTEVFDSELIGEGALPTFHHAVKDLLEENAIIIPSEAKVYIQLIESPFLWRSQALNVLQLNIPSSWKQCRGPASLWDVHLEEVSIPGQLVVLSEPHLMGRFDFNDVSLVNGKVFPPVSIRPAVTGRCHGVAVWWTLTMSPGVELSMSPWQLNWQWRDHWLPCVQLYTQPIDVIKDELIQIQLISDEYTIWTDVCSDANSHGVGSSCDRPVCTCGAHMAWSRNRLRMINDNSRNEIFVRALQKVLTNQSTIICVSDGSLIPFICAHHFPFINKIFAVESNKHSAKCLNELIIANSLSDKIKLIHKDPTELSPEDIDGRKIDVLISEPFFITATQPWHNLHYWYIRSSLTSLLPKEPLIMPWAGYLRAIAVRFENLHLLKSPVGTVEGFDITSYDDAVAKSYQGLSSGVLPPEDYRLWEYPTYGLSGVQTLMKFDFSLPVPVDDTQLHSKGKWELHGPAPCHGVVMWMEYQLLATDDSEMISEGLLSRGAERNEEKLKWSTCHSQSVCFFIDQRTSREGVAYDVAMDTRTGDMTFKFN